jgi:SAM-dependent methyltransferase
MSARERTSSGRLDTRGEPEATLDLYEATARYYDLQYRDFPEDVGFYIDLAEMTGGPVLECMCGTGRIIIPMAEAGFKMVGVDRSPAMLDECARKIDLLEPEVQERIQIVQEDVRTFTSDEKFKLAIIPFNSFLHLLETEDQEEALRNVHKHTDENGLLLIGVFNPDLTRPEGVVRTFDHAAQKTTVHYFYDISRQDKALRRVTAQFTLRYVFHREMVELLERTGFEVLEVYGDYELSPFRKGSDQMVFLARRC